MSKRLNPFPQTTKRNFKLWNSQKSPSYENLRIELEKKVQMKSNFCNLVSSKKYETFKKKFKNWNLRNDSLNLKLLH